MPEIKPYIDLLILAGPILVLFLGLVLWMRQSSIIRMLDDIGQREEHLIERLEDQRTANEQILSALKGIERELEAANELAIPCG